MAKFPYLTQRQGSRNLCYKRDVEPALWAEGRPKQQIWRSLKTSDRKQAEKAYAALHAEVERLLDAWRKEDQQPVTPSPEPPRPLAPQLPIEPLTPSLLKRLSETYHQEVFEADFKLRGELWTAAEREEEAFWREDIIEHPKDDIQNLRSQEFSCYVHLMEDPEFEPVFLYCLHMRRKKAPAGSRSTILSWHHE